MAKQFLAVLFLGLLSSCGSDDSGPATPSGNTKIDPSSLPKAMSLKYDISVPSNQEKLLEQSLRVLSTLKFQDEKTQSSQLIDQRDFSNASLVGFLNKRAKLIVGQYFSLFSVKIAKDNYNYFPISVAELGISFEEEGVAATTIMDNLGAAVYIHGKKEEELYRIPTSHGDFDVKSPRVGLLRIGPGLFNEFTVPNSTQNAWANDLLRLSVLFHEARHSDGHDENLAFQHEKCRGGDYHGLPACDKCKNGPYALQSVLLGKMIETCSQCTEKEKEILRLFSADLASRTSGTSGICDGKAEETL